MTCRTDRRRSADDGAGHVGADCDGGADRVSACPSRGECRSDDGVATRLISFQQKQPSFPNQFTPGPSSAILRINRIANREARETR